jgi:hypothetical protein
MKVEPSAVEVRRDVKFDGTQGASLSGVRNLIDLAELIRCA